MSTQEEVPSIDHALDSWNQFVTEHEAELARLRADIAALSIRSGFREMTPLTPILKEAVADSAPTTTSFKADVSGTLPRIMPYAALMSAAVMLHFYHPTKYPAGVIEQAPVAAVTIPRPTPPAYFDDDAAQEALHLAQEWHLNGEELSLAQRLETATPPPGAPSAWNCERVGEHIYHVTFHPINTALSYDFDVDLELQRVDPTAFTAQLLTPQVALRQ